MNALDAPEQQGIDLATFIFRVKIMIFDDFQKILENPWILAHPGQLEGWSIQRLQRRRRSSRGGGIGPWGAVGVSEDQKHVGE